MPLPEPTGTPEPRPTIAPDPEDVIVIAGPTAVGKSNVALELARLLEGEIVSVDSMQVYRGLDIGTAKPDTPARADRPHHLIDVADPGTPFDAAAFRTLAAAACAEILSRGRTPILCGGTGLYFRALFEGLGSAPGANADLRRSLLSEPLHSLLEELRRHDPIAYERIDRSNPRRIQRAVEVIRLTGRPYSEQRFGWQNPTIAPPWHVRLEMNRDTLAVRINTRTDAMFQAGLVDETRRHRDALEGNPSAAQAIGYRQVLEFLRGERSLQTTVELVKVRTRQFAKRQRTWFRNQSAFNPVEVSPSGRPADIAREIAQAFERRHPRPTFRPADP